MVSIFLNFYFFLFLSLFIMGSCAQHNSQMERLNPKKELKCRICRIPNKKVGCDQLISPVRDSNQLHGVCRGCVKLSDDCSGPPSVSTLNDFF